MLQVLQIISDLHFHSESIFILLFSFKGASQGHRLKRQPINSSLSYVSLTIASLLLPLIHVPDCKQIKGIGITWFFFFSYCSRWVERGNKIDISNICYWHTTVTHIKACLLISKWIYASSFSLIHCTLIGYWGAMAIRLPPVPAVRLPWAIEIDGWGEMREEKLCYAVMLRLVLLNSPQPKRF